jgi:6-phosphogluconate dehydrogenase
MRIIFVGLGKMGSQIVVKLLQAGHQVVAIDPNPEAIDAMVDKGAASATSREDAIHQVRDEEQPIVWLMIPSQFVDDELNAWGDILPQGSILIDGGNSDYRLTKQRAEALAHKSIRLLDIGTSGGVMGLENGFCMMVGGEEQVYYIVKPLIQVLAEPAGGEQYFGNSGAGHYVKMIHNGIEYAIMQSLAEGYQLLAEGPYEGLNLAEIAKVWQKGSIIESKLNGLIEQVYTENPFFEGIEGHVDENGEGRWTLETAASKHIPLPALQAALNVRFLSRNGDITHATKLLAAMRNAFGGHAVKK